ncbi:hypothetical protein [Sulfitobacter sp.]|uniref:hypothetical protein n=1 Tax=Sulfitobacter sp. TaxID=1903071 RepID=UPI003002684E
MAYQTKIDLDIAFIPLGTPMFADLIIRLDQDQSLNPTRRRDLISGLNRVAKALGCAPQDVPCHTRWLQPRLSKIAPAAFGLSPKTWQNAVSNARAAMVHVGIVERRARRITDLSPGLGRNFGLASWPRHTARPCNLPCAASSIS